MNKNLESYKEKLTELEMTKELLLNKLKKSYINSKVSKQGDAQNIYNNDLNNIEKLNSDFFLLENEIKKELNNKKKSLNTNNDLVKKNKELLLRTQENYLKEKSSNDADVPRYYELLEITRGKKIEFYIKLVVLLGLSYLIYKLIKGKKIEE